ncbi:hypothetical protein KQI52_06665 [bacterium]|nr:hypothetical protein [bacterium]
MQLESESIVRAIVSVPSKIFPVVLHLPEAACDDDSVRETAELLLAVAVRDYNLSLKALRRHDYAAAIEHGDMCVNHFPYAPLLVQYAFQLHCTHGSLKHARSLNVHLRSIGELVQAEKNESTLAQAIQRWNIFVALPDELVDLGDVAWREQLLLQARLPIVEENVDTGSTPRSAVTTLENGGVKPAQAEPISNTSGVNQEETPTLAGKWRILPAWMVAAAVGIIAVVAIFQEPLQRLRFSSMDTSIPAIAARSSATNNPEVLSTQSLDRALPSDVDVLARLAAGALSSDSALLELVHMQQTSSTRDRLLELISQEVLRQGLISWYEKNYPQTVTFLSAIEQTGSILSPDLYYRLGVAWDETGHPAESRTAIKRAMEMAGENDAWFIAEALYRLARLSYGAEAKEWAKRLRAHAPGSIYDNSFIQSLSDDKGQNSL